MKMNGIQELIETKIREILGPWTTASPPDEPPLALADERQEIAEQIERAQAAFENKRTEAMTELERTRAAWLSAAAALRETESAFAKASQVVWSLENTHDATIQRLTRRLQETADPRIDAAIKSFQDEINRLRHPATTAVGQVEYDSWGYFRPSEDQHKIIKARLEYCLAAIQQAETMKLEAVLNVERLDNLRDGINKIEEDIRS